MGDYSRTVDADDDYHATNRMYATMHCSPRRYTEWYITAMFNNSRGQYSQTSRTIWVPSIMYDVPRDAAHHY